MPSGAKKRKAARKKKEKEAVQQVDNNDNNGPRPQGNDDTRSQDERDSDGDTSSSASHCHDTNQQSSSEGNEQIWKRDSSSLVPDKASVKQGSGDIEAVTIDHDESSIGKSAEESQAIEGKLETIGNIPQQEAIGDSNLGTEPAIDLVKTSIPIAETPENAITIEGPETPECSEKKLQPPVSSKVSVAQRTSWLSCCGLFDMVLGSSR